MNRIWNSIAQAALPLALCQCSGSTECSSYLHTTVAEMRRANGSGCFELEHVVVVARTPSAGAPRVYVQDDGGGAYSAIRAKCDASPTHSCSPDTARIVQALIDGARITARGYYLQGTISGFEEIYLDNVTDEHALAQAPPPAVLNVAALGRSARSAAEWFQIATAEVPPEDPLVMYDFSPSELARGASCPTQGGFGVIPSSAVTTNASAAGCMGNGNPTGLALPDPREVLIGREFFKEFFASTDCSCALLNKQHLLSATSSLSGSIRGVLIPEITPGSTALFQVFHPTSKANFAISGG